MSIRKAPIIAALGLLSACAESYPPLYSRLAPVGGERGIDQVLRTAENSRTIYSRYFQRTAQTSDGFNLALVAAATAAGALIFGDGKHLAERLGYGAIGVGAATAARGVVAPPGMTGLYLAGHQALGCVIIEGPMFAGLSGPAKQQALQIDVQEGQSLADDARALFTEAVISSNDKSVRTSYQEASAELNSAVQALDTSIAAARQQLTAFDAAEPVFEAAVDSIHTRVATKGREGRTVDYAKLSADLGAAAKDAGKGLAVAVLDGGIPSRPLDDIRDDKSIVDPDAAAIDRLRRAAARVRAEASRLTADTPDFKGALARVASCPAKVST